MNDFEFGVNMPILWMCKEGSTTFVPVSIDPILTEADIVADKEQNDVPVYSMPSEQSFEFTVDAVIPRKSMFALFMGCNKRAIRRAIRRYETLRRKELKSGMTITDKVWTAIFEVAALEASRHRRR